MEEVKKKEEEVVKSGVEKVNEVKVEEVTVAVEKEEKEAEEEVVTVAV